MTQLLILGAHGQIGNAVALCARRAGIPYDALGRARCDIADRADVERAVKTSRFVVNCAAYTAVDRAETEVEAAHRVNTIGAQNVASACAEADVPLVHLSTDYVFDGESREAVGEDDSPHPLNVYGESKLGGEVAVRKFHSRHIILRTSWVFSASGQNFVKSMLRLANSQSQVRVVDDQIGGPTAAHDVAKAILDIMAASTTSKFSDWGTYHFSGTPAVSWCGFARAIVAGSGTTVLPIKTDNYPSPARRPLNSVLDCSRILQAFGIKQPDWRTGLRHVLETLRAES